MDQIEKLLHDKLGLEISSVGKATLKRAVDKRMRTLKIEILDIYINELHASGKELNELVEEVVVPETWFFRDTQPFIVMTSFIAKKLLANKDAYLRILSSPCSTGEEAYSMVIALYEANISPDRFSVHAIDISTRSLERAQEAIYRQNSFREKDLHIRYKYFKQQENLFILQNKIKEKVRFLHGNILDRDFMKSLGRFDVLFCRNVLIYLDSQSRDQAFDNINTLLAEDGILFVGHAESGLLNRSKYVSAPYPKAFAFYKNHLEKKIATDAPVSKENKNRYHQAVLARTYRYSNTSASTEKTKNTTPLQITPQDIGELESSKELIESGKYEEAVGVLKSYLNNHGTSAEAYYLLGMVQIELGATDMANKLLKKVVYLEPDHQDALVLLAMLADRAGDLNRARLFEERVERLKASHR
jgi:chemotaxis protein methyltransferase WspC